MSAVGGKAVNFAFTGTDGIADANATYLTGKMQLQELDHELMSDEEQVRTAAGALVNRSFYNPGDRANLKYIPSGAAAADAIANTTLPPIGTVLSITACASEPSMVKTNWVVIKPKLVKSNTKATEISLELEAHAGITAALS